MEVILVMTVVIAICSIGLVIVLCVRLNEELNDKAETEIQLMKLRAGYEALTRAYLKQSKTDYNNSIKHINNVPKDTLEAVKYAMNKAHPDNAGDAEKFMRYKKCYDELRGEK